MLRFIFGVITALIIFPLNAISAELITFDGGVLMYEKGTIDPETFNGKAFDVTIQFDGEEKLYINRYEVDIKPVNGQTHVKTVSFDGISMVENSDELHIGEFKLNNVVLKTPNFDLAMLADDMFFEKYVRSYGSMLVKDLSLFLSDNTNITMDEFKYDFDNVFIPSLPDHPLQVGDIELINFSFYDGDQNDREYSKTLALLGIDHLNINAIITSKVDEEPDRIISTSNMIVTADGIGLMQMDLGIGFLNSGLAAIAKMAENPEMVQPDEVFGVFLTGGFFNSASISLNDQGLLSLTLDQLASETGVSKDEMIDEMMYHFAQNVGQTAPMTYAQLAGPVEDFLRKSGTIEFIATPPQPLPFTSFFTFLIAPDQAAQSLGLTVTHQP